MNYEIVEEIYQGYCRSSDQSRIVTCEFQIQDGKKILDYVDCAYGACIHTKTCKLMQPIREMAEGTGE